MTINLKKLSRALSIFSICTFCLVLSAEAQIIRPGQSLGRGTSDEVVHIQPHPYPKQVEEDVISIQPYEPPKDIKPDVVVGPHGQGITSGHSGADGSKDRIPVKDPQAGSQFDEPEDHEEPMLEHEEDSQKVDHAELSEKVFRHLSEELMGAYRPINFDEAIEHMMHNLRVDSSRLSEMALSLGSVQFGFVYSDDKEPVLIAVRFDGTAYPVPISAEWAKNWEYYRSIRDELFEISDVVLADKACYPGGMLCTRSYTPEELGLELDLDKPSVRFAGKELALFHYDVTDGDGIAFEVNKVKYLVYPHVDGVNFQIFELQWPFEFGEPIGKDPCPEGGCLPPPFEEGEDDSKIEDEDKANKDKEEKDDKEKGTPIEGTPADLPDCTGDDCNPLKEEGDSKTPGSNKGNGDLNNGGKDTPGSDIISGGGCSNKEFDKTFRVKGFGTGADEGAAFEAAVASCQSSENASAENSIANFCRVKCPIKQRKCKYLGHVATKKEIHCDGSSQIQGQGTPVGQENLGGAGFDGLYPSDPDTFWVAVFGKAELHILCKCEQGASGSGPSEGSDEESGGGGSEDGDSKEDVPETIEPVDPEIEIPEIEKPQQCEEVIWSHVIEGRGQAGGRSKAKRCSADSSKHAELEEKALNRCKSKAKKEYNYWIKTKKKECRKKCAACDKSPEFNYTKFGRPGQACKIKKCSFPFEKKWKGKSRAIKFERSGTKDLSFECSCK